MRKLASTVHVHDPETGRSVVFMRGSTPPKRLQELIINPDVWDDEDPAPEPEDVEEPEALQAPQADPDEPPRAGKGSSRDAWAAYAAGHGVTADDDASRDDIIAALVAAGKISE